jgi:large subunit ribosomal protein L18
MRTIKKRRRQGKTDYKTRIRLLESGLPRIVVRITNRYVLVQYIKSNEAKDKIIVAANSKELLKYGWPKQALGNLKSIPACYLTGLLLGKKIKQKQDKENEAVLDIGLARNIKKGRIYGALKGLIDSGINIQHDEKILPDEQRIKGEHLKNKINMQEIKDKIIK